MTQPKPVATGAGELAQLGRLFDEPRRQGGTKKVTRTHVEFGATMKPKEEFHAELLRYALDKGYKLGWAANKYKAAIGSYPPRGPDPAPRPVSPMVASWIQAQNIRYAKSQWRKQA